MLKWCSFFLASSSKVLRPDFASTLSQEAPYVNSDKQTQKMVCAYNISIISPFTQSGGARWSNMNMASCLRTYFPIWVFQLKLVSSCLFKHLFYLPCCIIKKRYKF